MERKYNFRDPVVRRVVDKFVQRSDTGYEKYGKSLHDERTQGLKDLAGYLNDIQEELMDAILYLQAAREEVRDLVEVSSDLEHDYNRAEDYDNTTDDEF